jgi:hypothetical protein
MAIGNCCCGDDVDGVDICDYFGIGEVELKKKKKKAANRHGKDMNVKLKRKVRGRGGVSLAYETLRTGDESWCKRHVVSIMMNCDICDICWWMCFFDSWFLFLIQQGYEHLSITL